MHSITAAPGGIPTVVEMSQDVDWVIVADYEQEPVARIILARAALNGVKTALVLAKSKLRTLIRLYPVLSMESAAGFTCPLTRSAPSAVSDDTGNTACGEIMPVICRQCGETHAWAKREAARNRDAMHRTFRED
jgi:hypothetical protein